MMGKLPDDWRCPLRCSYHGPRRQDGTWCDSTYGGFEQSICKGENYCPVAVEFYRMQCIIDDLKKRVT